jgi:hypothetical protein
VPLRLIARLVRTGAHGGWVVGDLNWGRLDTLGWFRDHGKQQVRLLACSWCTRASAAGRAGTRRPGSAWT